MGRVLKKVGGLMSVFLLAMAALGGAAVAQPVDSITHDPAEPTSTERVRIEVAGFWTCPELTAPEVVGSLVVLSFGPDFCLAPPTFQVIERFVPALEPGEHTVVVLDQFDGRVLAGKGFQVSDAGTPPMPAGEFLTSEQVPGFRFKVRITDQDGQSRPGRPEEACLPETVCASGALEGRTEVLLRVVGPKPNGYLWPTFVRFTTSAVEVWVERIATSEVKYYALAGTVPDGDDLEAGFDRVGFQP